MSIKLFNSILNYKVSPDWELDKKRAYRQVNGFLAFMGLMAFAGIFIAYLFSFKISIFIQILVTIGYLAAFGFIRNHKLQAARLFSIYTFEIAMLLNSLVIVFPTSSNLFPFVSFVSFTFILYPVIAAMLDLSIKTHTIWGLIHIVLNVLLLHLIPEDFLLFIQSHSNLQLSISSLAALVIILTGGMIFLIYREQIFVKQKKAEYSHELEKMLKASNETLAKIEHQKIQIEKQRKELQMLNATKDRFFSIIAHDLRSPFNSIVGFLDLLKTEKYNEEDKKKIIHILHESATTAYGLVNNLLDWSRTQFNNVNFNPEQLNLKIKMDNCIQTVESTAWNKQITIKNLAPDDLTVFADREMMVSIIRNLLTNAIKFTNKKGMIQIDANKVDNEIEISIKDSGIGMTKKDIRRLFSSNNHQSKLGTASEKGSGLGLMLCREFVKKHNGRIWVESEPGEGSTFYIKLPLDLSN